MGTPAFVRTKNVQPRYNVHDGLYHLSTYIKIHSLSCIEHIFKIPLISNTM